MNKTAKFLIALFTGFVIFVLVMGKIGWESVGKSFLFLLTLSGVTIFLITLILSLISVWRWKVILTYYGEDIPFKKLIGLWMVGFAMSYLTPVSLLGGEVFRIYFTRKKFKLKWETISASVVVDKILDGFLYLFFLILGLIIFSFYGSFPFKVLTLATVALISFFVGLIIIFLLKSSRRESMLEWFLESFGVKKSYIENKKNGKIVLRTERDIMDFFILKKEFFWRTVFLSFLKFSLYALRALILVFFLTNVFSLSKTLAIYGITNLIGLIPIPAMLGSLEAAGAFAFNAFGFKMASGTVFSMGLRNIDLIFSLIGVVFLFKFWLEGFESKILDFVDKIKNYKNKKEKN